MKKLLFFIVAVIMVACSEKERLKGVREVVKRFCAAVVGVFDQNGKNLLCPPRLLSQNGKQTFAELLGCYIFVHPCAVSSVTTVCNSH